MSNSKFSKKAIILIVSMCVLAVVGGVFAANKLFVQKKTVQAGSSNEVKSNIEESKNKEVKVEENNNGDVNHSSSTEVEDSAYLEKYIAQQVKGEMPEGADGKKVAYLTFDDGPSKTVTPRILNILKDEDVHATFFLIGQNAESDKELVKREHEEGHTVGIHSYSHDFNYLYPGGRMNKENCMADFQKTEDLIKSILGDSYKVRALRFPGGYYTWEKNDYTNAKEISDEIHKKDWHQIDWNALSGDAEGAHKNAEQLYDEVVKSVGNREKALILMHDTYGKEATAEALPKVIKYLKSQGYEFKTIQ